MTAERGAAGRFLGTSNTCTWCGREADKSSGVYLERLYPGGLFCRACGRRTLFCECPAIREMKAAA